MKAAKRDRDKSCKTDVGNQALRGVITAALAPIGMVSRNLEIAQRESGVCVSKTSSALTRRRNRLSWPQGEMPSPAGERRSLVFCPALPMVSVDTRGPHDHSSRDVGALASGWLSSLSAVEIKGARRTAADSVGTACADPAHERREPAVGRACIHGELLKLGFEVSQSSVAKYMIRRRGPPSQG
jgi:hypothetical protein